MQNENEVNSAMDQTTAMATETVNQQENQNQTQNNQKLIEEQNQKPIDFDKNPEVQEYVSKKIEEAKKKEIEAIQRAEEEARLREIETNLSAEERKKFQELSTERENKIKEYEVSVMNLKNTLLEKEVSEVMIEKGIPKEFRGLLHGGSREEIDKKADILLTGIKDIQEKTKQEKYKNISVPESKGHEEKYMTMADLYNNIPKTI